MSLAYSPSRLTEFLPLQTDGLSHHDTPQPLIPAPVNDLQYYADLALTHEAPANDSWQTRLHSEGIVQTDDAEFIAHTYLAHLGSTGIKEVRVLELDRPLVNPSGASNLRLTVTAPGNMTRRNYDYTLTTYTPRHRHIPSQEQLFDEDLYQQIIAEGKLDARQAERAVVTAMKEQAGGNFGNALAPLPPIANEDIYSRFSLSLSDKNVVGAIRAHTYITSAKGNLMERTIPISAAPDRLEAAYATVAPRLTALQQLLLEHRGAHTLAQFDLSLAVRGLVGDKPIHHTEYNDTTQVRERQVV